ncbi:MAG: chondroitinase-B domain-containing protein [Flavobacteriaceae bacterium]
MKHHLILVMLSALLISGITPPKTTSQKVSTPEELEMAIANANPGDVIVMANGDWDDLQIRFIGKGTAEKPITLTAETPGKVIIQGKSNLKFGGEYLVVSGLHFKNGYSPSFAVIEFKIDHNTLANHCRVTNCVIEGFNKMQRNYTDLWILFNGRHNQLDHSYLAGKSNRGPTIRVDLEGNESIKNYHQITNNHFGPRPPKGGASAETIQIGTSTTSMSPSHTLVADNLFERCNGEVEIISSKANYNEFRNNVFYKSEGSLVTRHGNYCTVDGNYFIGDVKNENIGGIRIIGTGHWVTNNYLLNLKGQNFRSPLAVMNGIPKSSLNRYKQVTDVVVAHNSWINCTSPLQFGVGSNLDQKDVLPASEIRSAVPIRTIVANNLIYNSVGDDNPIVAHDNINGINFQNNIISNQGTTFEKLDGLNPLSFEMTSLSDEILVPSGDLGEAVFAGFEFETISKDLFGNSRMDKNAVGAVINGTVEDPKLLDKTKYGTDWYTGAKKTKANVLMARPKEGSLMAKILEANSGDIVSLEPGTYEIKKSLVINKKLTLQSKDKNNKATILYSGNAETPAFEMNPKGKLKLNNIVLKGTESQYAFASLKENMSSLYNLKASGCEISNFNYVLKGYKFSFSENISFNKTTFKNCENGIELSAETDDKGDYNAENLTIENCQFDNIRKNVVDYYRGGYDESTVGGTLVVSNSTFTNCGGKEENGVLLNTYGIINVDISENTFKNNPVKLVAQLWGAKNNIHADNEISNSGKLVVEENLKLKLMY